MIFMVREYIASPAKKPRTKNSESIQNTAITKLSQENSCWLGGAPKLAYSTAIPTDNPTDVSAPIVQMATTFGEGRGVTSILDMVRCGPLKFTDGGHDGVMPHNRVARSREQVRCH